MFNFFSLTTPTLAFHARKKKEKELRRKQIEKTNI
jgi:hypothetical protein